MGAIVLVVAVLWPILWPILLGAVVLTVALGACDAYLSTRSRRNPRLKCAEDVERVLRRAEERCLERLRHR